MAARRPDEGIESAAAVTARAPLISVILACRNAAGTIRACVESVLAQKAGAAELLIVDGGSTDGTLEVVEGFRSRLAYFRSKPDGGVYFAWNEAIERASGEWVYFLGADDVLRSPDVFAQLEPVLRASESAVSVVYGKVAYLDAAGREIAVVGRPWEEARGQFFRGGNLCHQGVFHRRSLFSQRRFDTSFRLLADYEFLLGVLSTSEARFVPGVVVAGYSTGGASSRPGNFLRSLKENHRALRKHGFGPGFFRKCRQYAGALCAASLVKVASAFSEELTRRLMKRTLLAGVTLR